MRVNIIMLDGQNCHIQDSFFLIAKPKVTVDQKHSKKKQKKNKTQYDIVYLRGEIKK